ncbi:MAG: hypothetical protein GY751_07670 [Bacteroidetes bacterium]|nr:hypothetical protein [Bacteroidota bacterium]
MSRKGRIAIKVHDNYLEVSIKVLRNMYVIVPLVFSALIWMFGLAFLIDKVFQSYRTIIEMGIAGMLFFWLVLGGAIFSTLFWIFYGKERLIITEEMVMTEKPIHLYKRRRSYAISDIYNIRVAHELYKVRRNGIWEDDSRTILRFETPFKNVAFGRGITPEENELILVELARCPYFKESQFAPVSIT